MPVRARERRTAVRRKVCFFTMNSLCQIAEAPSKLTRVPSPLRPGQAGQRTSRVTSRKQSALISYPGIAQRTRPTWLAALQKRLWKPLFSPAWFTLDCLSWDFSGDTIYGHVSSPKRSSSPQICRAGDTYKIKREAAHSKQTRIAFTPESELPRSLFFLTAFPRQKRGQTDLGGEMSFLDQLPWQPRPCLPRAPAPGACTCQLVARVAQQP